MHAQANTQVNKSSSALALCLLIAIRKERKKSLEEITKQKSPHARDP